MTSPFTISLPPIRYIVMLTSCHFREYFRGRRPSNWWPKGIRFSEWRLMEEKRRDEWEDMVKSKPIAVQEGTVMSSDPIRWMAHKMKHNMTQINALSGSWTLSNCYTMRCIFLRCSRITGPINLQITTMVYCMRCKTNPHKSFLAAQSQPNHIKVWHE